jgi:protein-disulfide isomerase
MARVREVVSNVVVALCVLSAIIASGYTIRDHAQQASGQLPQSGAPVAVSNWASFSAVGHRFGPSSAPVTIVEFGDFECPACRHFEPVIRAIRAEFPTSVSLVFRHWPLPYHRFAIPSARAAECASAQGRFEAMHDLLYAKQDSLGIKPFSSYATDAGVADTAAFNLCNRAASPIAAVARDSIAARALGGRGTPTILVNQLRLTGVPDSATLERMVKDALHLAR